MHRRPKGQRAKGRSADWDDDMAGGFDEDQVRTPNPMIPSSPSAAPRRNQEADRPGGPSPHPPAGGRAEDQGVVTGDQGVVTEDQGVVTGDGEQELGSAVDPDPGAQGRSGGPAGGVSEREGGKEHQGVRPQHSHTRPHRVRPAQNKAGTPDKHGQAYASLLFPLDPGPLGVSGTQSESAISGREITSRECLFYGANVGTETRNMEFKRGGGEYLRSAFRGHLRRYACAFLNSGGGSLLAGVDDGGVVRGLRCDHRQEDRARLLADSVLRGFLPPLLPHSYGLAFLPVVRPGPEGHHLKVLRLTLRPPQALGERGLLLYQTDQGEVFVRRDGSVEGPLPASAIQEWARQRWSGKVKRLQQCVELLLSEQSLLIQEVRQQRRLIAALRAAGAEHPGDEREPGSGAPSNLHPSAGTQPARTPLPPQQKGVQGPPRCRDAGGPQLPGPGSHVCRLM